MFFELCTTYSSLHVCILHVLSCFLALRFRGGNAYFQQLLILSRLTGYYFRVITSYCIQYGCFLVFLVSLGMTINILLSFCAARDTHFSALVVYCTAGEEIATGTSVAISFPAVQHTKKVRASGQTKGCTCNTNTDRSQIM